MRSGVLSAVLGALVLTPLLAAAQGTSYNGLATEYGGRAVSSCCQKDDVAALSTPPVLHGLTMSALKSSPPLFLDIQDGGNPEVPVYGLIDGACGYGALSRTEWPYWRVAALSFSNPVSLSGTPQKYGCGACIEVTCQGSVRLLPGCCPAVKSPGHM